MHCPKCKEKVMETETILSIEAQRCPHCHGLFLAAGRLQELLQKKDKDAVEKEPFTAMSDQKDMEMGRCPACDVDMEPCWGPANMRLDKCPQCEAVFLDQGELSEILAGHSTDVS